MENHPSKQISQCKKLIEKQLAWPVESKHWKQRDYLNLISLIETKTGTLLSLSTIKRIWRTDYSGTPHPTTLDALAKFLGHDSWLSFQAEQQALFPHHPSSPQNKSGLLAFVLLSILVSVALLVYYLSSSTFLHKEKHLNFNTDHVSFSATNSKVIGVPNTVIFNYQLGPLKADSFFIQQSWNPFNREKINPEDSVLTSIYYFPGVHIAKLIANDSIVKETTLRVQSDGWMATVDYGIEDLVPKYIDLNKNAGKPELNISQKQINQHQIKLNDQTHLCYFYVNDIDSISGDHFNLSIHLNVDSLMSLACPKIGVMIMGTVETHGFTLIDQGCIHNAFVKFGEVSKRGRNNDLSNLGVNVYEAQQIVIQVVNKKGQIYLDDQLILELAYTKSIGDITGFSFSFTGLGRVNALDLKESNDGLSIFSY